jgi:glycosyltransferase involved in cell wall biosynthesis
MSTSLIITTYNRPKVLSLVLKTIARQSELPDEVVIADDGSADSTAEAVHDAQKSFPVPIIHVRQDDEGFRVARVRNLGAYKASGDFLIYVDGDMLLHKDFVKSHKRLIRPGRFLHGPRVLISKSLTEKILENGHIPRISPFRVEISHRFNMIHNPWLSQIVSGETTKFKSRACNLSMYKSDYVKVNGFNEDFTGWGEEDSEFTWRLMQSGLKKINVRFSMVGYHLDHGNNNEIADHEKFSQNVKLFQSIREQMSPRCDNGYNNHVPAPVLVYKSPSIAGLRRRG